MRIAHVGALGVTASRLAQAQRRLGHDVVLIDLGGSPTREPADVRIPIRDGPIGWNVSVLRHVRALLGFEVLHIHGGISRGQIAYPALRSAFDARLAVHYYGGANRSRVGLHHRWAADVQFHSSPAIQQWVPRSQWIPDPVEVHPLPDPPENQVTRFACLSTGEADGGAKQIMALFETAFGSVRPESRGSSSVLRGRDAELLISANLPREEATRRMGECDVVIDPPRGDGTYSILAAEAMALGKPVVGAANEAWYPGCPIVPLAAGGIDETLRDLARDSELRRKIGRTSHAYAAKVHESGQVARHVLRAYYRVRTESPLTAEGARAYWTRRGGGYFDEFAARPGQPRYAHQVEELLAILGGLQFDSVVELGCGFGRISRELVRTPGRPWVGVDLSRDQLARVRTDGRLAPKLVEASGEALPIPAASFDLALCVEMLMHVPPETIRKVAAEMWRVARRHIVHLDWFEDYMVGEGTGWCWVHDYEALWRSLGGRVRTHRLDSMGIQSVFVVEKPMPGGAVSAPAHG